LEKGFYLGQLFWCEILAFEAIKLFVHDQRDLSIKAVCGLLFHDVNLRLFVADDEVGSNELATHCVTN